MKKKKKGHELHGRERRKLKRKPFTRLD